MPVIVLHARSATLQPARKVREINWTHRHTTELVEYMVEYTRTYRREIVMSAIQYYLYCTMIVWIECISHGVCTLHDAFRTVPRTQKITTAVRVYVEGYL